MAEQMQKRLITFASCVLISLGTSAIKWLFHSSIFAMVQKVVESLKENTHISYWKRTDEKNLAYNGRFLQKTSTNKPESTPAKNDDEESVTT